jgi:VWFA-related protein
MQRDGAAAIALSMVFLSGGLVSSAQDPNREESGKAAVIERVEKRLVQVDVSVRGPRDAIAHLTARDFELSVGGREIPGFEVDAACPAPNIGAAPASSGGAKVDPSYLLFFDQNQMSAEGRTRSLALASELVPLLARDGGRVIVASSGQRLQTYAGPTSSVPELLAALGRVESDASQKSTAAADEEQRIASFRRDLARAQNAQGGLSMPGNPPGAGYQAPNPMDGSNDPHLEATRRTLALQARAYQNEEKSRVRKSLERLGSALERIGFANPPKSVIYFADLIRLNAGDHYFRLLEGDPSGREMLAAQPAPWNTVTLTENSPTLNLSTLWTQSDASQLERDLQRLTTAAAARGTRIYTIRARGYDDSGTRARDAGNALVSLARETGGTSFITGAEAPAIAAQIAEDASCLYFLSFDPQGLPQDRALPVRVALRPEGLEADSRGTLVVEGTQARLDRERRAVLFGAPRLHDDVTVRVGFVPLGYDGRKYQALLHVGVLASPLPDSRWRLSVSVVRNGDVVREFLDEVRGDASTMPLVVERQIEIGPGSYALVAMAEDSATEIASSDLRASAWPDADTARAAVTPVALLQPAEGVFEREDVRDPSGSLVLTEDDAVRIDRPLALVGVVCRGAKERRSLIVERRLEGAMVIGFTPISLRPDEERCLQVRDLVPPASLEEGLFRYEIAVRAGDEILTRSLRPFRTAGSHSEGR